MRTWHMLVNVIEIFSLLFMMRMAYNRINIYEEEYNELCLSNATEYATEAAFVNSIGTVSKELSYVESVNKGSTYINLDSSETLYYFDTLMALNYGMSLCNETFKTIEDGIGVAVLIGNSGYSITKLAKTAEDEVELRWSSKMPYVIETSGTTFAVTLNNEAFQYARIENGKMTTGSGVSYKESNGLLTDKTRKRAVATTLTDAITKTMDTNAMFREEADYSVYLPTTQTLSGINAISTPSILVVMRDTEFAGVKGAQKAALTALRTVKKIRVIGYRDANGNKKYVYEFQGMPENCVIETYFGTIEEAADNGYMPDYEYIFDAINYDGASVIQSNGETNKFNKIVAFIDTNGKKRYVESEDKLPSGFAAYAYYDSVEEAMADGCTKY